MASQDPVPEPGPTSAVLDSLREHLTDIGEVAIGERPALLEQANEALVAALADLEEA